MPIVPQNLPQPQQNRTEVGVRSLNQSSQPAALKKGGRRGRTGKTKDGAQSSSLDRVSREDTNLLVDEVGDERHRRGKRREDAFAQLEAGPGHVTTMVRRSGRAFRIDDEGRTLPPHYSDVEQGNLQDAWLLATLAAVAEAQPGALIARVRPDGKRAFTVHLGDRRFPVTPEFPSEGYAEPEPGNQADTLWVALLEKAFALDAACSYAELEAGNPSRAFPLLIDGRSRRHRLRPSDDGAAQLERLRSYRSGDHPMVLVSRPSNVANPFVADHAYALVDVDADGRVKLYNPWGTRRGTRSLDAVLHHVPWSTARTAFEFLYVGGIA